MGSIRDRNINWRRQLYRIPWTDFHRTAATDVSMADGALLPVELSTFGVGGLAFQKGTGSICEVIDWRLLTMMDFDQDLGFRVLWCNTTSGAGADDITFKVMYLTLAPGAVFSKAPDGVLTTAIAAQDNIGSTTYVYRRSSRGVLAAGTFGVANRDDALLLSVSETENELEHNEAVFLALEIDYVPSLCVTPSEAKDAAKLYAVTAS